MDCMHICPRQSTRSVLPDGLLMAPLCSGNKRDASDWDCTTDDVAVTTSYYTAGQRFSRRIRMAVLQLLWRLQPDLTMIHLQWQ